MTVWGPDKSYSPVNRAQLPGLAQPPTSAECADLIVGTGHARDEAVRHVAPSPLARIPGMEGMHVLMGEGVVTDAGRLEAQEALTIPARPLLRLLKYRTVEVDLQDEGA